MAVRTAARSLSFYFDAEDKRFLEHAAKSVGMSQSDVMRRLIRAYTGGAQIPGLPPCPTTPKAKAWVSKFVVAAGTPTPPAP